MSQSLLQSTPRSFPLVTILWATLEPDSKPRKHTFSLHWFINQHAEHSLQGV